MQEGELVGGRYDSRSRVVWEALTDDYFRAGFKDDVELLHHPLIAVHPRHNRRIKKAPKPLILGKRPKARLTPDDQKRIVFARYGSLTDFSAVKMTYPQIERLLMLPRQACLVMIHRFHQRGNDFSLLGSQRVQFSKLLPIKHYLVSPEIIKLWRPYGTKHRRLLIQRLFGIDVGTETLRRFYHHVGITY